MVKAVTSHERYITCNFLTSDPLQKLYLFYVFLQLPSVTYADSVRVESQLTNGYRHLTHILKTFLDSLISSDYNHQHQNLLTKTNSSVMIIKRHFCQRVGRHQLS